MDALNQLQSPQASNWHDLCLGNVDKYLEGSKAPDNKFKDFRNHVLHVQENYWGGAVAAAQRWYDETVAALKTKRWADAVYAAGVLSHYYTDPIQPLHTGQCEAEGVIHQACEWSIACAYRELTMLLESGLGGWPTVNLPSGNNWLKQMVTEGANLANPHYEACLQHYDLASGTKNPPKGLDEDLRIRFARLIGHAVVGYARILDRALEESQVRIPATNLTLQTVVATISIPILWVTKKMSDAKERALVEAVYREYQQNGKVIDALSSDDKSVREIHAAEVRQISKAELDAEQIPSLGTAHGTMTPEMIPGARKGARKNEANFTAPVTKASPLASKQSATTTTTVQPEVPSKKSMKADKYYLNAMMDVEKAPSIGPKSAAFLAEHGIKTVGDLLRADAVELATQINDRNYNSQIITDWQTQARLCCEVPNLRGHDAQILTAVGVRGSVELSQATSATLLKKVNSFVETSAGQRILRGGSPPDLAEIKDWISWSQRTARPNAA